ncbi:hypothetical protein [Paenibacillus dokdonensis]|uniref:hypothetical protein n=1 Tax=Paenibacillus dokdonensis TaxID=2567944 RepID=UPI003D26821E
MRIPSDAYSVIGTVDVNKEVLRKRTEGSFATVTELADTLVRTRCNIDLLLGLIFNRIKEKSEPLLARIF